MASKDKNIGGKALGQIRDGLNELTREYEGKIVPVGGFVTFSARIAKGSTHTIVTKPQVIFKGRYLVVSSACKPENFTILDGRVGQRCQTVHATEAKADQFVVNQDLLRNLVLLENGLYRWDWDACQIGQDLSLVVRNDDMYEPRDFMAILWGDYAHYY